jgi:hypothetical protein
MPIPITRRYKGCAAPDAHRVPAERLIAPQACNGSRRAARSIESACKWIPFAEAFKRLARYV